MGFFTDSRDLWRSWIGSRRLSAQTQASLRAKTQAFCSAQSLATQTECLIELFAPIWSERSEPAFQSRFLMWLEMLERDDELRGRFQQTMTALLGQLDAVLLLAEAGIPAQNGLLREVTSRLFERWLPPPRNLDDAVRLLTAIFGSARGVRRFTQLDGALFARSAAVLQSAEGPGASSRIHQNIHEALRLLAARVSARGTSRVVRERSTTYTVEQSPPYALVFATEALIACEHAAPEGPCPKECMDPWLKAVFACRGELAIVRLNMEHAGVNAPLVFDLCAMDAALNRMELLAATLMGQGTDVLLAIRRLLNELLCGLQEDIRISALIQQNLNLLARKTVERTGHGGEHYIAHTPREYWRMWGSAIGGGLLTVGTAAIKLHVAAHHWPPFMEAILVGTNYAVSFLLMQIGGLALATKQPAATGAALANIIRRNRGESRRGKIAEYGASICRTQLATALGNVLAVCAGAIVFNLLWTRLFHAPYLQAAQAEKVYTSLRPFRSATAVDAAMTGVLLWLAGMIGGWCENFAVFHRIPASIAEHRLGQTLGVNPMQRFARWVDERIGPWTTSVSLGYLLGFTPQICVFLGLPLDVRHVTLNTGMFVLAASRVGLSAFRQEWLYAAAGGIAIMFVLNLGVSFAVASLVALRAYDVGHQERTAILRYVLKQIISSPMRFLLPVKATEPDAEAAAEPEERSVPAA